MLLNYDYYTCDGAMDTNLAFPNRIYITMNHQNENKYKISIRILLLIPGALLLLTIVALLLPGDAMAAFEASAAPTGTIIVYVKDGPSDEPLENARVVIPEMGQSFLTDKNGSTGEIYATVLEDADYKAICPQPWGEITLLIYKPGYADCAIFHVNIMENKTRNGPTVLLFPLAPGEANDAFTLTEAPNKLWVKQLLDRFRQETVH